VLESIALLEQRNLILEAPVVYHATSMTWSRSPSAFRGFDS